jgi:hypothetical protein
VTNVTNRRAIRHATLNAANSAIYSGYLPLAGADDCRCGNAEELPQAVCIKSFFFPRVAKRDWRNTRQGLAS